MKKFVEKLIGRLEEASQWEECTFDEDGYSNDDAEEVIYLHRAIEIVKQLAEEYNNGWIPCEKELPKYTGEYNVTVVVASEIGSFEDATTLRFENIKGKEPRWIIPKDEIYRVIAWQPLPEPFKPSAE